MNADVQFFGQFKRGFTQFPEGEQKSIVYKKCIDLAKCNTQLVVHREGSLMYYSYVRGLSKKQYIGIGLVLNGSMLLDVKSLIQFFEETIGYMADRGMLINIAEDGEINPNSDSLNLSQSEIEEVVSYLRSLLVVEEPNMSTLPPVDFSIQKNCVKEFLVEDSNDLIVSFSHKVDYVVVYKDADFNTMSLVSSIAKIKQLGDKNKQLENQVDELKKQYSTAVKKQKQYTTVTILTLVLFVVFFVVLVMKGNLDQAHSEIASRENTISEQNSTISSLEYNMNEEMNKRMSLEDKWNHIVQHANSGMAVTHCEMDYDERSFMVYYLGISEDEDTIGIQVYTDNGHSIKEVEQVVEVELGEHVFGVPIDDIDPELSYLFVVSYKNKIIGGLREN